MQIGRLVRSETLGNHNFGSCMVFVAKLADTKGRTHRGISALAPGMGAEVPFRLSREDGVSFANYLQGCIEGPLPSSHQLWGEFENYWNNLYVRLSKRSTDDSRGLVSGSLSIGNCCGRQLGRVSVTPATLNRCALNLRRLYDDVDVN